jgi:hypothetical protein
MEGNENSVRMKKMALNLESERHLPSYKYEEG